MSTRSGRVTEMVGQGKGRGGIRWLLPAVLVAMAGLTVGAFAAAGGAGALDPSFGSGGTLTIAPGDGGEATGEAVLVSPDGTLQAAGSALNGGARSFLLASFTAAGAPDPSFNGGHPVLLPIGAGHDARVQAILRDSAGRLVVAGAAALSTTSATAELAVARFTAAGVLDTSFGTGGTTELVPFPSATGLEAHGIALDSQGRIVIAGFAAGGAAPGTARKAFLARLTAAGTPDGSWSGTTPGVVALIPGPNTEARAYDVAVDAQDRPVVAGSVTGTSGVTGFAVMRFTTAGRLDTTFAPPDGYRMTQIGTAATAHSLVLAGGKPLLAGSAQVGSEMQLAVARYTADGLTDMSFHATGVETESGGSSATAATVNRLALQSDGKPVLAGQASVQGRSTALIARLTPDGGLDQSFGTGGVTLTEPSSVPGSTAVANGLAIQSDGNSVTVGTLDHAMLLARYLGAAPASAPLPTTPATTTTSTTGPTPAPAGGSNPPPAPVAVTLGPDTVTVGDPASFTLPPDAGQGSVSYAWSVAGGDPALTGTRAAALGVVFATAGSVRVTVDTVDGQGHPHEFVQDVTVTSPLVGQLSWAPRHPKPRERVRFTLNYLHDPAAPVSYFTWRFGNLPASIKSLTGFPAADVAHAPKSGGSGLANTQIVSHDVNVTKDSTLSTSFPAKGFYKVAVQAVTPGGLVQTVRANVAVGIVGKPLGSELSANACAAAPELPCPTIISSGDLVTGAGVTFAATPPALSVPCGKRGGGLAHKAACAQPTVVQEIKRWDFGDGSLVWKPGPHGTHVALPLKVMHTFSKLGNHAVTVTVQLSVTPPGGGNPTVYEATDTVELDVVAPVCHALTFAASSIPVRASAHCLIPIDGAANHAPTMFRPYTGDGLDVNGVVVRGLPGHGLLHPALAPVLVPQQSAILHAGDATFDYRTKDGGQKTLNLRRTAPGWPLVIGPAAYIPKVNVVGNVLPGYTPAGLPSFGGLPVLGAQVIVSTFHPALARLALKLPKLYTGTADATLLSPLSANVAEEDGSHFDVDLELPSGNMGPFTVTDLSLKHRKPEFGGGWIGGGTISILGTDIKAPPIPPGDSSPNCGEGGPSGFGLGDDGSFQFAGASVIPSSDITLGPIGLRCLQFGLQVKPSFALTGKVGVEFPPNVPLLTADGCFYIALPNKGDPVSGCGFPEFPAAADGETDIAATLNVRLLKVITLAQAQFAYHHTDASSLTFIQGSFGQNFGGVFGLDMVTLGLFTDHGYFFGMSGKVCVGFCLGAGGIISNRGFAACALFLGAEYLNADDSFHVFPGCDLSSTAVAQASSVGRDGSLHPWDQRRREARAASAVLMVNVPKGESAAAFVAHGAGGAPTVAVTDPTGRTYTDTGDAHQVQRYGEATILHLSQDGETMVTVRGRPPGGAWKILTLPGSVPLTRVETAHGLPPTRIVAHVVGDRLHQRLSYRIAPVPGQSVSFLQEGTDVGQPLGDASGPTGSLPIPATGLPGRRRIVAVVARNGLPYKQLAVATFRAAGPPPVPAVHGLRATVARGSLMLHWTRTGRTSGYRVVARTGDGRTLVLRSLQPSARIAAFDPAVGAEVSVAAIGAGQDDRRGPASRLTVRRQKPRRVTVRI